MVPAVKFEEEEIMFEAEPVCLAVLNETELNSQTKLYFSQYHVVGIVTSSVEKLKGTAFYRECLCLRPEVKLYEWGDVFFLNQKLVVLDWGWADEVRIQFGKLLEQGGLKIGFDFIYESMQNGKIDTNIVFELTGRNPKEFHLRISGIASDKKLCVIHGNCQSHAVTSMLCSNREFRERYVACVMPQIWEGDEERKRMELMIESKIFALAGCFITQKVAKDNRFWHKYATEYLRNLMPRECRTIVVSNLFFQGYFPQYKKMKYAPDVNFFQEKLIDATEYTDINVLKMVADDMSDEEIIECISSVSYYGKDEVVQRIQKELLDFKQREQDAEVRMADYLEENYDKFLMFATANHPTRKVLIELSRRILKALEIDSGEINCPNDEIQAPMPKNWRHLIYPSVLFHLNINRKIKYVFGGCFSEKELAVIMEDIETSKVQEVEEGWYQAIAEVDFETYMRIYIRCLRASLMLL